MGYVREVSDMAAATAVVAMPQMQARSWRAWLGSYHVHRTAGGSFQSRKWRLGAQWRVALPPRAYVGVVVVTPPGWSLSVDPFMY